jgi:hypothetical protein
MQADSLFDLKQPSIVPERVVAPISYISTVVVSEAVSFKAWHQAALSRPPPDRRDRASALPSHR